MNDLFDFLLNTNDFIGLLILVVFAIALVVFLINVVRYFFMGAADEEKRERARRVALYAIAAFVFLGLFWWIVNTIVFGLPIGRNDRGALQSDYIESQGGSFSESGSFDSGLIFDGGDGSDSFGGGFFEGETGPSRSFNTNDNNVINPDQFRDNRGNVINI